MDRNWRTFSCPWAFSITNSGLLLQMNWVNFSVQIIWQLNMHIYFLFRLLLNRPVPELLYFSLQSWRDKRINALWVKLILEATCEVWNCECALLILKVLDFLISLKILLKNSFIGTVCSVSSLQGLEVKVDPRQFWAVIVLHLLFVWNNL